MCTYPMYLIKKVVHSSSVNETIEFHVLLILVSLRKAGLRDKLYHFPLQRL